MKPRSANRSNADEGMPSEMEVDEHKNDKVLNENFEFVKEGDDGHDESDGGNENGDDDEDSNNEENDEDVEAASGINGEEEEDDDDDEQLNPAKRVKIGERSEFFDAFYGLASDDARERSRAGQVILYQSLVAPQVANVSDATYALKRLLNGLCSGRASARQGNASTLASFLKVAKTHGYLTRIQQQQEQDGNLALSAYIRKRVILASSIVMDEEGKGRGGGRKKASEIKDHKHGRLFGILAIVRSGILMPDNDDKDSDKTKNDASETTHALITDLQELYQFKPYMREPVAHAVCTLLSSFICSNNKAAKKIACHLVEHSVIPLFLQKGDLVEDGSTTPTSSLVALSAEQMAIAINIQSFGDVIPSRAFKGSKLLKNPILTKTNIPDLAATLAGTCSVSPPRMHLVWDTLWLYLTTDMSSKDNSEKKNKDSSNKDDKRDKHESTTMERRFLRKQLPFGGNKDKDTARNILETILKHVLDTELLSLPWNDDDDNDDDNDRIQLAGSKLIERRTLAMHLIQCMAGVEFVSSLSGRTVLAMDCDVVLFQDRVVRELFLTGPLPIGASGTPSGQKKKKQKKSQARHRLKALALECLNRIVESASAVDGRKANPRRRFEIAKCLVRCDPRFDIQTKTTAIQDLLGFAVEKDTDVPCELWSDFIRFLQERILTVEEPETAEVDKGNNVTCVSPHEAMGLIDILFRLSKRVIWLGSADAGVRAESDVSSTSMKVFKESTLRQILSYLVAVSFVFPKNTSSKGIDGVATENSSASLAIARRASDTNIPHDTRKTLQSRLFSLLTEQIIAASSAGRNSRTSDVRETEMLKPLLHVLEECQRLEKSGFIDFGADDKDDEEEDREGEEGKEPTQIISDLLSSARKTMTSGKGGTASPRYRFIVSMGVLASFLGLCLFSNQDPCTELGDISEMANTSDSDEIEAMVEEAGDCSNALLNEEGGEPYNDALSRLIALCLNLMAWESDESRGTSKRLIREIVKVILPTGMLIIAKSAPKRSQLDPAVVEMMLDAVGVEPLGNEDGDDAGEEGDNGDSEDLEQDGPFTKSAALSLAEDDDEDVDDEEELEGAEGEEPKDNENAEEEEDHEVEEEDVVLDDTRLQSLLEDDSDVDLDESELEHHEGADAALAQFIKIKQEARKAGQVARERVELSRQLRCLSVLETVVTGKPESWGPILRCDIVVSMLPSILGRISQLDKTKNSVDQSANERAALLKGLTGVFKKLLKSKMWTMAWTESIAREDHCNQVLRRIMELSQLKRSTNDQKMLCYQAMPTVLRCLPSQESRVRAASDLYSEAVMDWSTRKSTRSSSHMFEELLHRDIPLAQSILVGPLSNAIPKARVRFLKSECFRLIFDIYNPKINKASTGEEKQALATLMERRDDFLCGAVSALRDTEMLKSKDVKAMTRTIERVISFESPDSTKTPPLPLTSLQSLEDALQFASQTTESENAKQLCETVLSQVETWKQQMATQAASSATAPSGKANQKKKTKKRNR